MVPELTQTRDHDDDDEAVISSDDDPGAPGHHCESESASMLCWVVELQGHNKKFLGQFPVYT